MLFPSADLEAFWFSAWATPLRSACRWLTPEVKRRVDLTVSMPTRLGPQCLSRWVGQAIQDRFAWQRAHPDAAAYRHPDDSAPIWEALIPPPYERGKLRALEDEWDFAWHCRFEVERLMRLLDVPPVLVGREEWTAAVLGICERLARLYGEMKRRYRARQARAIVCAALAQFVEWDYSSEA